MNDTERLDALEEKVAQLAEEVVRLKIDPEELMEEVSRRLGALAHQGFRR